MSSGPAAPDPADAPGRGQLGPAVERFDERVDELLEHLRGHPATDRLFTTASHVGDFSLVWHAASLIRGSVTRRRDQVLVLAAALGVESLIVNQGLKRLFRRTRPTVAGDERFPVRRPSTSAFPSGHASSALFAATILASWDRRPWSRFWYALAAVVGVSRAYVRIHHASDVVGGAAVGRALGLLARRLLRPWAGR